MASSVPSERAFSIAGITITKRRNCLKGDIVEALQCLKSLALMARDTTSISEEEANLDWMATQLDAEMDVVKGDSDLLTDTDEDLDENSMSGEDDDDDSDF